MNKYLLIHEHLSIKLKDSNDYNYENFDLVVEKLNQGYIKGLSEILDVSNKSIGQNFSFIEKIKEHTPVKILYSIGLYKSPYIDSYSERSFLEIYYFLKQNLFEGYYKLGYFPSVIGEVGASFNIITEMERRILTVCAFVAKEFNLPLVIHTTMGTCGLEIFQLLSKFNLSPRKMLFSHMDLCRDINEVLFLLSKGVFISYDTFGKEEYMNDEERIDKLLFLLKEGYHEHICISTDITKTNKLNEMGYDYIIKSLIPALTIRGINKKVIDKICYFNARSFLYGK